METTRNKHSKCYYEKDRNMDSAHQTPHSTMTDVGVHLLVRDKRVPEYYVGKNGYEARKVVDNFDLSYHIGTAVTYLLRAYKKHDTPTECIKKAIAHLEFQIEELEK
jgi:hypothetical protein